MLSAQYAKVWNDVIGNKTRTILIILSIMVGLTAVGTVLNARTRLNTSVEQAYAAVDYAQGVVITTQSFDKDLAPSLSTVEGVDAVGARRTLAAQAVSPSGKRGSILITTVPDYQDMPVNRISPVQGEWPPLKHRILIESSALDQLGAQPGETILVELPGGNTRSFVIGGTVSDRSQPPAIFATMSYGYVDRETMEWLGQPSGFNQLYVHTLGKDLTKAEIQAVLARVATRVEKAGYTVVSSQAMAEVPVSIMLDLLIYILTGIGGLSLFLSIFLIVNTISAMVAQQTRQIGAMKAVGGRAGQILWMYLSVVLFYGLAALSVSIPLSIVAGHWLTKFMLSLVAFEVSGSPVQPESIVVLGVIATCGPTLAALLPLQSGLRVSAAQALSSDGGSQAGMRRSLVDRVLSGRALWFARYILLRPVILALRNIFRHKTRLILTLATLTLAGAVFISIFNLRATIFSALADMSQMQSYDLTVNLFQPDRADQLQLALAGIPGVQAVDTRLTASVKRLRPDGSESDSIALEAVRLDSRVVSAPKIMEGRWLEPGDENALVVTSPVLKNEPDLAVGQTVQLEIGNRTAPFTIVGIAMGMGMGADGANNAYASSEYMEGLVNTPDETSAAQVVLAPGMGATIDEMSNRLESMLKADGFQVSSIATTNQGRKAMESNFTSVLVLLLMMASLLATVGGIGLMGTMSINVIERTREIGVLRAIGASNRGVNSVFMIEGVCIGMISCLFAIPFSYPVTDMVSSSLGTMATGSAFTSVYTPLGIAIWMVIIVILSLAANYLPARSAVRLTVREVLAYE